MIKNHVDPETATTLSEACHAAGLPRRFRHVLAAALLFVACSCKTLNYDPPPAHIAALRIIGITHALEKQCWLRTGAFCSWTELAFDGENVQVISPTVLRGGDYELELSLAKDGYALTAAPIRASSSHSRSLFYYSDESMVIRWESGRPATAKSPVMH